MKNDRRSMGQMLNSLWDGYSDNADVKMTRTKLIRTKKQTNIAQTDRLEFPKNKMLDKEFEQEINQMHINIEKDYQTPKRNFIYNDNLYELIKITDDAKYKGIDVITNEIVKAKQKHCVLISADEHYLVMLYWMYDYFKIIKQGNMKPIPFNVEHNEYHDKWNKYGTLFCGNLMRTLKRKIIQAYGKD